MSRKVELTKENCKPEAGLLRPVIDQRRCEGKEDCLVVCPHNVFEVRKLTSEENRKLILPLRFKVMVHGGKQAFAVRAEDCHSCGLCVTACPEKAIKLVKASSK